jgi:ribose transport system ATP-binding protein
VLILDEPTKGIDVGTKADLYGLMRDLVEGGEASILFISSDLDELLRCANSVITIYDGSIAGEFDTEVSSKTEIVASMIGGIMNGKAEAIH